MLISVCICTYHRPHLTTTLASIGQLQLPPDIKLEIIVVDNDEQGSGRERALSASQPWPLHYRQAQGNNISVARNKTIATAQGEWLAFIDDDEVADPYWLAELLKTAQQYQADAVFGHVRYTYPTNAPNWIRDSGVFDKRHMPTGTIVTSGSTGSTLLRHQAITDSALLFNQEYGQTGGEDADLFYRLHCQGYKLVRCAEALVSEEVTPQRLTLTYLVKKSIRIGESYTRYRFSHASWLQRQLYLVTVLIKLIALLPVTLIKLVFGKQYYAPPLLKLLDKYGKIKALFSKNTIKLYGSQH